MVKAPHNPQKANERLKKRLAWLEHFNVERVKELSCLYGISKLIEKHGSSIDAVLRGTVELLPPAWQYPAITRAMIACRDKKFFTPDFEKSSWVQSADFYVDKKKIGTIEVYYLKKMPSCGEGPFLKEERALINAIAEVLGKFIERARALALLKESRTALAQKNKELEKKNIALQELVAQFELEKRHLSDKVAANAQSLLMPLVERLAKKGLPREYLNLIREGVNGLVSNFGLRITDPRLRLSAREVETANLIKQGFSSKQIADILSLSFQTVESYRKNMRRKLGLTRGKVNLTGYLKQL